MNDKTDTPLNPRRSVQIGRGHIYGDRKPLPVTTREKSIFNTFTNEIVKFPYTTKTIECKDIAKSVARAEGNRRDLEGVNLKERELYKLIKEQRVITENAIGFTIDDDPTIYLINGWTRANILIELDKIEDIQIDLPIDIMRLTEDDLWVVTALVCQSNTNTVHNPFEQSELMMDFYKQYAKANPESSTRQLYMSVGTTTLNSPSYSRFKAMLFFSCLRRELRKQDKDVLNKIKTLKDVQDIMAWMETKGGEITIVDNNLCIPDLNQHLTSQLMPYLDEIFIKLEDHKTCKEAFKKKDELSPDSSNPIAITDKSCSINFGVSRSDVTPEAMKRIVSLFKENEAVIQSLMDQVNSIVKEDSKLTN